MFNQLRSLLAKQFRIPEDSITMESELKKDLHADSIDFMQLLMTVEDKYGITIPDEELADFETVGDIVKYLEKAGK